MRVRIVTLAFTGRAHNAVPTSCPVPAISSQSQKDMYLFGRHP